MIDKKLFYLIHLLTLDKCITLHDKKRLDKQLTKLIKLLEEFSEEEGSGLDV